MLVGLVPAAAAAQGAGAPQLSSITTIKAIRALSQDEGAKGYPVRIRGVVTHFDEVADGGLMIHDGDFGQFFVAPEQSDALAVWRELKQGESVEIDGRTVRGGFAPNVVPTAIRRLGPGKLPTPKRIAFGSMLTGRSDCDYVEIVGVVQRTWRSPDPQMATLFAEVSFEEGVIRATFWDHTPQDLDRLIDARVRLRGNVGTLFGRTEQLRGVSLFAGRTRDIVMLEPAPEPFSMPVRSIRGIYNYSAAGEVNRRIRIRGVVTSYVRGRPVEISDFSSTARFRYVRHVFYVSDGGDGARIETEQPQRLLPGTIVDVAGFPAVTPGKPILTNAIFKVAGDAPQPAPVALQGANVLSPENDATLIRMEGQLLSVLTNHSERVLVLRVGDIVLDAKLEADEASKAVERIRPGSVVAVTGVYSYRWGPPPSFQLFLRSAQDVSVVTMSPWWTVQHTGVMLAILTFVACGVGLWARMVSHRKHREYLAVLNERSRVGRELHDTFEQGLAGIALQLEAVAGRLPESGDSARQSLDVARQMLRYSQEEARRSVMDLRSQALESRDLAGAISDLARQMTQGTSSQAFVEILGTPRRLDAWREHHLLRVGLEALTNAIKHSGAKRIRITLQFRGDTAVQLTVQDDGCGLDEGAMESTGTRFGLQGMRERVDKLGGVLGIESTPGNGTEVTVIVPAPVHALEHDTTTRRRLIDKLLGASWRTS
jgi:signal transduction histidine kinase